MAAMLKAPEEMVKEITAWAQSIYCKTMFPIVEARMQKMLPKRHKHKEDLKRLAFVRAFCIKRQRSSDENPQYFPLDLYNHPYFTKSELEQEHQHYDNVITATFYFDKTEADKLSTNWRGLFSPDGKLSLYYPIISTQIITAEIMDKVMEILSNAVHHELQHLVQFYMKHIKGLPEIGGLPSKNIRDTDFDPYGRSKQYQDQMHGLHDVEFYTVLSNSVSWFRAAMPKFPVSLHRLLFKTWIGEGTVEELERATVQEYHKDKSLLKRLVGARTLKDIMPEILAYLQAARTFFNDLKTQQPGKYKKAVSEFYKAVQSQL